MNPQDDDNCFTTSAVNDRQYTETENHPEIYQDIGLVKCQFKNMARYLVISQQRLKILDLSI